MADRPEHPITTPRGASALTILLAVVSVFAPFVFNLQAALLFAAVAIVVIGWIYASEARSAISERRWTSHLNVPLGCIAIIIFIGIVSIKRVVEQRAPPPPPPALSADDVAKRVIAMMPKPAPVPEAPPPPPAQSAIRAPAPMLDHDAVNCKTEFPYIAAALSGMKDGVPNFGISINYSGRLRQHNVAFEFMSLTKDKPMIQPRDFNLEFLDPGSQSFADTTPLFEFGDYDVHIRSDECELWERMSLAPGSNGVVMQKIVIVENGHTIKTIE